VAAQTKKIDDIGINLFAGVRALSAARTIIFSEISVFSSEDACGMRRAIACV
jgi:hypothetical protein